MGIESTLYVITKVKVKLLRFPTPKDNRKTGFRHFVAPTARDALGHRTKFRGKLFTSTSPATQKCYRSEAKVASLYFNFVKSILSFKTDKFANVKEERWQK